MTLYVYATFYPFICQWTLELLPLLVLRQSFLIILLKILWGFCSDPSWELFQCVSWKGLMGLLNFRDKLVPNNRLPREGEIVYSFKPSCYVETYYTPSNFLILTVWLCGSYYIVNCLKDRDHGQFLLNCTLCLFYRHRANYKVDINKY
jgi:hypothetical protein